MATLIVTLPQTLPTAATLCEGVLSVDGSNVQSHFETTVALLPAPTGTELVLIVPLSCLSWHKVDLPQGAIGRGMFQDGGASRLRAVLDGLLEERVLDETAQLHFALQPQARSGTSAWVAACDRAWLRAWLAELEQAGRTVTRIVPELAPTAAAAANLSGGDLSSTEDERSFHVMGTPDKAKLVVAGPQGVTVLPLSQASATLLNWSDGAVITTEPATAALAEAFFKTPVPLQTPAQRWLGAAQSDWDMAQFDLLSNRRARTQKRASALVSALLNAPRWRAARWAVLCLLLVNLIGLQALAMKERSALVAKRAAMTRILTSTFPDVRVVVDAPLQMARALSDLQRSNGTAASADLETMLSRLQAAAPELPTPSAIEFIANELKLQGIENQGPGFDALAVHLRTQGYSVQLDGNTLTLREASRP